MRGNALVDILSILSFDDPNANCNMQMRLWNPNDPPFPPSSHSECLDVLAVPFLVHLALPVLAVMSDTDAPVRSAASRAFARLVRLMPLDGASGKKSDAEAAAAVVTPRPQRLLNRLIDALVVGKGEALTFGDGADVEKLLKERRVEDHKFLEQLLRPKKIPDVKLGFDISSKSK